ncbi:MAG TPA: hypothetical protein RMH99_32700 [Sandaracinaceae bacterium LLY-WYZ-13_1]|nr:hypothetical protein [Sandaracinaceae bacterium LLY-WYZ-13_1]
MTEEPHRRWPLSSSAPSRAGRWLPALVVVVLVGGVASAQSPPSLSDYAGRYRLQGSMEQARSTLMRAADHALRDANALFRTFARAALPERVRIPRTFRIETSDGDVEVRADGRAMRGAPDGRAARRRSPVGEPVRLTYWFRRGQLVQSIAGEEGSMTRHFTLRGDRLEVTSVLRADRLPEPIRFDLVYRRR